MVRDKKKVRSRRDETTMKEKKAPHTETMIANRSSNSDEFFDFLGQLLNLMR